MITNTDMAMGKLTKATMTWTSVTYIMTTKMMVEKMVVEMIISMTIIIDEYHEGEGGEEGENFEENSHCRKGYDTHGHHEVKKVRRV